MGESQRVKITKYLLHESLVELMQTKELKQITVTELCRKAEMNRTTFYKHYTSPIDVFFDVTQAEYANNPWPVYHDAQKDWEQLVLCLEYMEKNDVSKLMNEKYFQEFQQGLFQQNKSDYFTRLLLEDCPPPLEKYVSAIMISLLHLWLHSEKRESPRYIATLLFSLKTWIPQVSEKLAGAVAVRNEER